MPHFHLSIDLVVLVIAIPIGMLTYRRKQPLYLKLLPFFLLLILLVELTGEWFQEKGQNNLLLYNFSTVMEFCYYTFFFKQVTPDARARKIIGNILWILPALCLADIFLLQGPYVFHTYTYSAACLVTVGLGITYFYALFKNTERIDLLREPAFWMSIGIIFFCISSVSVIGAFNYIAYLPLVIRNNLQRILLLTNAFFYLIFIIAFLCKTNIRKYLFRQ